jgi:hypothetical protein
MTSGRSKVRRSLAILGVAAMVPLVFAGTASAANPNGNNGIIKLDGVPFDIVPDNQPHVGCDFQVDFYNYDLGNTTASVKFVVQPPTGKDIVLTTDTVFIGGDAALGGNDLDGTGNYNLGSFLQAFEAHPVQGYHIKVTVKAPGSAGADTKYKTFWVQTCS